MQNDLVRQAVVIVCVFLLALGPAVNPLFAATPPVTGRIAGNVVDRATGLPVEGSLIEAQQVTTNALFVSPGSDGTGGYLISEVPSGIYAVSVSHDGVTYPVEERFDVRTRVPYLLEACFELDRASQSAALRADCASGLYAQRQVVALGANRYFDPDLAPGSEPTPPAQEIPPLNIVHSGLGCVSSDVFPQVDAQIFRDVDVSVARVFFRSSAQTNFYSIDLQSSSGGFLGILPRPSPETTEIVYYVEALDTSFTPVQSIEFTAPVLPVEECRDRDPTATYFTGSDPGITVTATQVGAAAQPPGFLSAGIVGFISASGSSTAGAVATGGGLSTLALILILGGAAAATTVFIIAATDEDEASEIR